MNQKTRVCLRKVRLGKTARKKGLADNDVGRIYYGAKGVESLIADELHDTSPEDRAATGFKSLWEKEAKIKSITTVKNGVR